MGIEFPESRCELSPNHAHYFIPIMSSIWRCKYCWAAVWLPNGYEECAIFSDDIGRLGLDKAYQKHLQDKPVIRQILRKLEEIRLLRKVLSEEELMIAVSAIVADREEEEASLQI